MKNHNMYCSFDVSTILVFFLIIIIESIPLKASAGTQKIIQEIEGFLQENTHSLYVLSDLKKGDTVFAYMERKSGNLDPFLGVLKYDKEVDIDSEEILQLIIHSEQNLNDSFSQIANNIFLKWDDDSGSGYTAVLEFHVPTDGTYYIFAGSMITNHSYIGLSPGFTFGSFRLLLGVNAPEVAEGEGEPSGLEIAVLDNRYAERSVDVQQLNLQLTKDRLISFRQFRKLKSGDMIYVRLETKDAAPLPRVFISDFGTKPLVFGNHDKENDVIILSYQCREERQGMRLYIDGSVIDTMPETADYQVSVGINAPEVNEGRARAKGLPVLEESQNVKIGLAVDQIADVDQRSEKFTVVGSLALMWTDPNLAFSPDSCKCAVKKMELSDLKAYASKNDILLPSFTFFNQQGKRWSQGEMVLLEPSGRVKYSERFTVTLQAPGFDFRAYPFDRQRFNIRIDLSHPTEIFMFEGIERSDNALGDALGEEEWSVIFYEQKVESVPFTKGFKKSRFTMVMEVKRHLNFYIYRIMFPLLLIISVSWVIFFLKDYGRQLEVASGNLLVFVAFNFTISNDLPRLGYLTLLDRVIVNSFCCAACVVLITVCQKRLEARGRKDIASKVDYIVLVTYPLLYIFLALYEYIKVTYKM